MKNVFVITVLFLLICSCKKEEITSQTTSVTWWITGHTAYYKGIITDSVSDLPITGYRIQHYGPKQEYDTLTDGTYSFLAYWFEGKMSAPKPQTVYVYLFDSLDNKVKTLSFDGDLLVEDDTIVVDFQITL